MQVWASRESQIGFKPFYEVVARHAGPEAVDLISAYWTTGDLDKLTELFEAAGLEISSTLTRTGAIRAPSIEQYVTTEIESTPLVERIGDDVYKRIRADARVAFATPVQRDRGLPDADRRTSADGRSGRMTGGGSEHERATLGWPMSAPARTSASHSRSDPI
ncbi:MAG: hypothetical protein M3472_01270 [Chloroflexota bacterium]|nr:hypothetical protein [Chloroflexota bacterium]